MKLKELLIKRIKEEKEVLKVLQDEYFVNMKYELKSSMDEQYGYVSGLMHALRLLEELTND